MLFNPKQHYVMMFNDHTFLQRGVGVFGGMIPMKGTATYQKTSDLAEAMPFSMSWQMDRVAYDLRIQEHYTPTPVRVSYEIITEEEMEPLPLDNCHLVSAPKTDN